MGMGIVNTDEFDSQLDNLNLSKQIREDASVITIESGRGKGNVEVPDSLRKVIGETSITDGRTEAIELGKQFGISASSVSAYSAGAHSTASYDETPNKPVINDAKERVARRARTKLMLALNSLTPDKIINSSGRNIAAIAKDMSAIVKNMEPDLPKSVTELNQPQFIVYAPQTKSEDMFDVVYSKD